MHFRVESRDKGKARFNRGVTATWTLTDQAGELQSSSKFLGLLQDIWAVRLGSMSLLLFKVKWFRHVHKDHAWGGLDRVQVEGPTTFEPTEDLIEASRVDGQFWLSEIPGSQSHKHAHYKLRSGYTIPEHLLELEEEIE